MTRPPLELWCRYNRGWLRPDGIIHIVAGAGMPSPDYAYTGADAQAAQQVGLFLAAGKAYPVGTSWGEPEALLTTERLRFPIPASAINYLFAFSIDGETIRSTMAQAKYPEAAFRLRRRQVMWIVRRGIVRSAHEKLEEYAKRVSKRRSLFLQMGGGRLGQNKMANLISVATAAKRRSWPGKRMIMFRAASHSVSRPWTSASFATNSIAAVSDGP